MLTPDERQAFLAQLAAANDADAWSALDRALRARPDRREPDVYALIKLAEAKSGPTVFAAMGRMVRPMEQVVEELGGGEALDRVLDPAALQNAIMQPVLRMQQRLARAGQAIPGEFGLSEMMRDIDFEMAVRATEADRGARMDYEGGETFRMFRELIVAAENKEQLGAAAQELAAIATPDEEGEEWRRGAEAPLSEREIEILQRFLVDRMWDFTYQQIQQLERHLGYEECVRMQRAFNGGPVGQRQVFERLETVLAEMEGREPDFGNLPPVPGMLDGEEPHEEPLWDAPALAADGPVAPALPAGEPLDLEARLLRALEAEIPQEMAHDPAVRQELEAKARDTARSIEAIRRRQG